MGTSDLKKAGNWMFADHGRDNVLGTGWAKNVRDSALKRDVSNSCFALAMSNVD